MTAIPLPKVVSSLNDSRLSLFPVEAIKKNLAKEFATPLCNASVIQNTECMKVYVRLRPLVQGDDNANADKIQNCMEISEEGRVLTLMAPKDSNNYRVSIRGAGESVHRYAFSQVFQPDIGQKDFFNKTCLKIVEDYIGGQNSLMFTYGVTSSGKTYTMQGIPGNEGIIPRSIDVIFNSVGDQIMTDPKLHLRFANSVVLLGEEEKEKENNIKNSILSRASQAELPHDSTSKSSSSTLEASSFETESSNASASSSETITEGHKRRSSFMDFMDNLADDSVVDVSSQGSVKFVLFVSFIEVYNELIYDLLQPIKKSSKRPSLRLAEDKSRPFVKDLLEIQVNSREEVFKLLSIGQNNLHMAETKLNHNSSRSHCIFTIKMVCIGEGEAPNKARVRHLSFCDLAGSERSGKTKSVGVRLNEARKINSSLLSLGKCVDALRFNQLHKAGNQRVVPFRESRLTRLFQSILQGDGTASMIVNVNQDPSLFDETIHVLNFSSVASELKVLEKPRHRSFARLGKRSGSGSFEKVASRQEKRFTIGWEPQQTPIKEQEEGEADEVSEEEYSDNEEYWEEREKELLDHIKGLESTVAELTEKLDRERDHRSKVVKELNAHFTEMLKVKSESADKRVLRMEKFGEEKYMDTVKLANETIARSEERRKELDEECDELLEKLNALEDKYDDDKPLHDQITCLEEELDKKDSEINIGKEENERMKEENEKMKSENEKIKFENERLKRSSSDHEREVYISSLLEENESGREIIGEQIGQIEGLEKDNADLEAKLTTLSENFNKEKTLMGETHEKEIIKLKSKIEELEKELEEKLSTLREKLDEERSVMKEMHENEMTKLKSENEKLEKELEEISSLSREQFNKEKCLLEKTHENEMIKLKSKIEELEKDLEQISSLSREQFNKEKCLLEKTHENEMIKLKSKIEELEKDLEQTSSKETESKEETKHALEELKALKEQEASMTSQVDDLKEELKKAVNETISMNQEKQDLTTQLHACKEEIEANKENETALRSKIQELEQELLEVAKKNEDISATLEEAVTCAETEMEEAAKFKSEFDELTTNYGVLQLELLEGNKLVEKNKINFEQAVDDGLALVKETDEKINKLKMEQENEMTQLKLQHQHELTKETKAKMKIQDDTKKEHKKQVGKLEVELNAANNTIEQLQKELQMGVKIEQSMRKEVETLQTEMKKVKAEKMEQEEVIENHPSKSVVAELEKDVRILTMERDDLVKTVQNMKNDFASVKHENQVLKNNQPALSVEKASEIEKMKDALEEMDKLQEKQQLIIAEYEVEKDENVKIRSELEEKITNLQSENKTVREDLASLMEVKASSLETESRLAEEAKERNKEIKRYVNELSLQKEVTEKLENQLKDMKSEANHLQNEVAAKEEKLQKFREAKHELASALERRMNTSKACNEELKKKLEDQIETNVKLRSENSKLKAELHLGVGDYSMNKSVQPANVHQEKSIKIELTRVSEKKLEDQVETNVKLRSENSKLKAELHLGVGDYSMNKSVQPANVHQEKSIKIELTRVSENFILSPHPAPMRTGTPMGTPQDVVNMLDQSTDMLDEMHDQSTDMLETPKVLNREKEDEDEKNEAVEDVKDDSKEDKRATRGRSRNTSRRTVAKKTLSRRKRGAPVRQATPIPEIDRENRSSFEEDRSEVSPVKSRRVLRTKKPVMMTEGSDECGVSEQEVTMAEAADDLPTTSNRLTEHEADFPKPELEIDATPVVKKVRSRKRTNKQQDDEQNKGSPLGIRSRLTKRLKVVEKFFDVSKEPHDSRRAAQHCMAGMIIQENSEILDTEVEKTRLKRRGKKKAQESAISDEKDSGLKLKSTNISRVGEIVGQALKKLEAAVSPSRPAPVISAPTGALLTNDPARQSVRRVRRLHADDISLPLQATPDEHDNIGAIGRGVGIPSQLEGAGSPMKRRLRKRK